ncbi:bifunctional glutamate N-acetyltransferase/amino-acid acetyltransferase ArgJ [Thiomicrospira microaerophila]|uniref:bifunctional glutamate N-acetyltransferase/amino-acid acetyltransferase ArgJ n=1 Tax=Thiomicrospira microaerophila TaxID=406020 RepID=UPI00200DCB8F|nr:bifunctional glutamate N-acetyltransferase/amino-acid acetyltransferase ArgJ [Thiomicrospira microaerophila]UQB42597.1 bifunctional glutamate N-acetyltransferase/amino-acid acetyltransferase ArgJ [Thiomicrospira microaerophila]
MPVGLSNELPQVHPVAGAYLGATAAKIKKNGKTDLVVIELAEGSITAATFTTNACCAAPVTLAKAHLAKTQPRALLINSGNANAATGEPGLLNARQTCQWLADEIGCELEAVLPFSTGVIGEPLPMEKIQRGLPDALANRKIDGWAEAMAGIMTTDIVPKMVSKRVSIDGHDVIITGMAKGSGMIHPNMATMLGFVVTDAKISQPLLDQCLKAAVKKSFNRITVDGDTSTNDACTLSATQQADMPKITEADSIAYQQFAQEIDAVMTELAHMIVRDGEGATKFIAVEVNGGREEAECLKVAQAVALSPLVKTAMFASDPNWGRILAAVGRAGVENLDINGLQIFLGGVCIVRNGGRAADYTEQQGQAVMNNEEISVRIELNRGQASETVWTCDFSYDYVKINAEYRS